LAAAAKLRSLSPTEAVQNQSRHDLSLFFSFIGVLIPKRQPQLLIVAKTRISDICANERISSKL
jgi:hypothetical protein